MNRKIYILLTLPLALNACSLIPSVGPDYERPSDPKVAEWIMDESGKKLFSISADARTKWWETFQDPALNELIKKGIDKNLTLGMALNRLEEARAQEFSSIGAFLPTVNGKYSATKEDYSRNSQTGGLFRNVFKQFQLGFDASWEIDIFGGNRRKYEAADALTDAALASADDVGVSVAAEIAKNYINYKTLSRQVEIAQNNAKTQQESKNLVQVKFDAGVVSELDLQQATSQLETTNATVPVLVGQRDSKLYRLAVLVGEPPQTFTLQTLTKEQKNNLKWGGNLSISQPTELLRIRPDVRVAERQLAAATAKIGVSIAQLFPKAMLVGGLGLQSLNSGKLTDVGSKYWSFGPQVSTPLFHGGEILSDIKNSRNQAEEALKNYELTVLTAFEDAQNALNNYKNSLDRIDSLDKAFVASKRALELSQDLYAQGLVDFQRVLEAERAVFSAEQSYVDGQSQTFSAAIGVYKAFAGGLPVDNKETDENENQ